MSENTETTNIVTEAEIEERRKKLLSDLSDVSNPDTRSLLRELFADFCKSKAAEAAKPAPAPDGLQDELKEAVGAVLRKHNIRDAECSIGIAYNSKGKADASTEAATSSTIEASATTPAPEDKRSPKDAALDNIIAWSDKQLTRVPCDGIRCDECPICIRIADRLICLKCAIEINVENLKKERNSHA